MEVNQANARKRLLWTTAVNSN